MMGGGGAGGNLRDVIRLDVRISCYNLSVSELYAAGARAQYKVLYFIHLTLVYMQ